MREWVEISSKGIQALAVVTIVVSIVFGSVRFIVHLSKRVIDPYHAYKELLGRSLLLSLEFLVAADVNRTVLLDLTAKGMEILGALVVVRTFLSLSLTVELDGHWPWRTSDVAAPSERVEGGEARRRDYAGEGDKSVPWSVSLSIPPATVDDIALGRNLK